MFGIEAFSLKNAYLRCIGEQLRYALNYTDILGKIYRGLTHYILAKHGGAQEIPRIKHQDCIRSPVTRIIYLIKKAGAAHLRCTLENYPLEATSLEKIWYQMATSLFPQMNPTQILKPIHKLLLHNIYDIKHLTLSNGTNMILHEDFEYYYTKPTKLIKQTLNTTTQLFCQLGCNLNRQNICPIHHPPRTLKQ